MQRLMRLMGMEAIYPKPKRSAAESGTGFSRSCCGTCVSSGPTRCGVRTSPTCRCNGVHVPGSDPRLVQPIRMAWRLSNTLDSEFCLEQLEEALSRPARDIQHGSGGAVHGPGVHGAWSLGVSISMDGRGRALDNVFIERCG